MKFKKVGLGVALEWMLSHSRNACVVKNNFFDGSYGYTIWENLYGSFHICEAMLKHDYFIPDVCHAHIHQVKDSEFYKTILKSELAKSDLDEFVAV